MKEWLKNKSECPSCRVAYTSATINRFALNTLNAYTFQCSDCLSPYSYEKAVEHLITCSSAKIPCPLKCDPTLTFGSEGHIRQHLKDFCMEMELTCTRCEGKVPRMLQGQHDCVVYLKARNAELVKELEVEKKARAEAEARAGAGAFGGMAAALPSTSNCN